MPIGLLQTQVFLSLPYEQLLLLLHVLSLLSPQVQPFSFCPLLLAISFILLIPFSFILRVLFSFVFLLGLQLIVLLVSLIP
jgi:hypothetical protein